MTWITSVAALTFVLAFQQTQAPPNPTAKPWEPTSGMAGKDVVWVPSTPEMVEKMLDIAKVTPQDVVMDLGSGDGRMIIAAAKRGALAIGVEYTPEMVEYSRRKAKEAGVPDKAQFVQGDMYVADVSKASVLALFLLPHNLDKMKDKFLAMKPGSRIVLNTYEITGWEGDERYTMEENCSSWCTVILHYVPAPVAGTWRLGTNTLTLSQEFQMVTGEYAAGGSTSKVTGRLKGEEITLTVGGVEYTGKVSGDRMQGTFGADKRSWTATRGR
jgi:SAM-dependent methyltransferase